VISVAGIVAVSCVPLPQVVVRSLPFHCTTEPLMKFVPVAVSVKPPLPATRWLGEIDVSVGAGLSIVNVCALDAPPPGAGLKTVTSALPGVAMSLAVICAVSCVLLPNVVALLLPFQRTTEEALKFVPVTVTVNAAPPAAVCVGEIEASVGAGLLIVNVWELDVPPPGVGENTVTGTVPPVAMSAALICAVSCV
jgi:hypothetical protein